MAIQTEPLNEKLARWAGLGEPPFPHFTTSLDACFRWLVPKLQSTHEIVLEIEPSEKKWRATLFSMGPGAASIKDAMGVQADTPAMALCLAIKKVIDAGWS